jgi:hypothetical protein
VFQGHDKQLVKSAGAIPPLDRQGGPDEHITLTQAAQVAPGRPSTNCMWRWCRRGVLARSGQRIRLQHVRVGGKIFTTAAWLREFGQQLAEADRAYFESKLEKAQQLPPRDPRYGPPSRGRGTSTPQPPHRPDQALLDRELEAEGL